MNSKRKYIVIIDEAIKGALPATQHIQLGEILSPTKDDYEYIYSLNDILDQVLDLFVMDILKFNPNRDNKNSKGLIVRLN